MGSDSSMIYNTFLEAKAAQKEHFEEVKKADKGYPIGYYQRTKALSDIKKIGDKYEYCRDGNYSEGALIVDDDGNAVAPPLEDGANIQ